MENTLEIEVKKIDEDLSFWHIRYLNKDVLKIKEYNGDEIKISISLVDYNNPKKTGLETTSIRNKYVKWLKEKFRLVNEKYTKRWRAYLVKEYYYLDELLEVNKTVELNSFLDEKRYKIGNYFNTYEEALERAVKLKTILKS